jgi:hypothetical protein
MATARLIKGLRRLKVKFKISSRGFFNTQASLAYCILAPTSSRIYLQRRHASHRCARPLPAKAGTNPQFCQRVWIYKNPAGIFYFPSEGRHTEDFSDARKIQRLRSGLHPRTRVPVASMLTPRPPKPSLRRLTSRYRIFFVSGATAPSVPWPPDSRGL